MGAEVEEGLEGMAGVAGVGGGLQIVVAPYVFESILEDAWAKLESTGWSLVDDTPLALRPSAGTFLPIGKFRRCSGAQKEGEKKRIGSLGRDIDDDGCSCGVDVRESFEKSMKAIVALFNASVECAQNR